MGVQRSRYVNADMLPSVPSQAVSSGSTTPLLTWLALVVSCLPSTIAPATPTDVLTAHIVDPAFVEEGDDAWETIGRALNRTLGYGKTIEDIASIIRRGPLGMDGVVERLRKCGGAQKDQQAD